MRITDKMLDQKIALLNTEMGMHPDSYSGRVHHVGTYYIDHAYGGVALEQIVRGGGSRDVLNTGHLQKRELYGLIGAYMDGIMDRDRALSGPWVAY